MKMWLIPATEGSPKYVRMAYLAIVTSFKINGVAELHSQLLQATIFRDFVEFKGRDAFTNVSSPMKLSLCHANGNMRV